MVALSPRTTLEGKSYLTETLLWFHMCVPVCTGTWNDGTPGGLSSVRAIGTPATWELLLPLMQLLSTLSLKRTDENREEMIYVCRLLLKFTKQEQISHRMLATVEACNAHSSSHSPVRLAFPCLAGQHLL